MEIRYLALSDIIPYARNPRENAEAIDGVAASIKEFGWKQPIVVDSNNIVVAGHTRLKAAQKLKLTEAPCLIASDLTPAQLKAYRILDNKVAENSDWDLDLLKIELEDLQDFDFKSFDLDITDWGFETEDDAGAEDGESKYTAKIEIPPYELSETKPATSELYDEAYAAKLVQQINAADLPPDIRSFLISASQRHTVFNYKKIADFYVHSTPEVQRLMEDSALVIVDFDKAIENGWVRVSKAMDDIFQSEAESETDGEEV